MRSVIILPRGMHFAADRATSIDLCVRDYALSSALRSSTTVLGLPVGDPFAGIDYRAVTPPEAGGLVPAKRRLADAFADAARALAPDVVLVEQHPDTAAQIARRLAPVPVVLHRHGLVKPYSFGLRKMRHGALYARMAAIVWVTRMHSDAFRAAFPTIAAHSTWVHNGIDTAAWRGAPPGARDRSIMYVGRLSAEKGVRELAEAVTAFLRREPTWRAIFRVAASGHDRAFGEAVCAQLAPVADRVDWRENVPHTVIRRDLANAGIAVVPSIVIEGFNRAAMEAHAAGCAVISSGSGGLREVSGDAALYLEAVSADHIAHALDQMTNDVTRVMYQEKSLAHAARNLELVRQSAKLDEILTRTAMAARRI
jgi:glycosyltransferase involved in cell wall biosynthesis